MGTTLSGEIDYRAWTVNPLQIHFRSNPAAEPTSYGVGDLRFFSIPGEDSYERAFVKEDMRPLANTSNLEDTRDTTVSDTVFLRVLVSGSRLSLFQLIDSKPHYYISVEPGKYTELEYKVYVANGGIETDTYYKTQLLH